MLLFSVAGVRLDRFRLRIKSGGSVRHRLTPRFAIPWTATLPRNALLADWWSGRNEGLGTICGLIGNLTTGHRAGGPTPPDQDSYVSSSFFENSLHRRHPAHALVPAISEPRPSGSVRTCTMHANVMLPDAMPSHPPLPPLSASCISPLHRL
jgi:hypothetical protein